MINRGKAFKNNEGFKALIESERNGAILKIRISRKNRLISYREALDLLVTDSGFVDFYLSIFRESEFKSYRWETPPVTKKSADRVFEFVILNSPSLFDRPDKDSFKEYFDKESPEFGVVSFSNLCGDAILIVPSPLENDTNYSGMAEFLSQAPIAQQRSLCKVMASQVKMHLSDKPIWVSVAGGGVAWLHVRLDTYPKYYIYRPYTEDRAG